MAEKRLPRIALGEEGYTISPLIVGGWQLSSGHRQTPVDEPALFRDLAAAARQGWTTFDCADIYTGVEERFGRFRAAHATSLRQEGIELQFHTKYVPGIDDLAALTRESVERIIDRSLQRLGVERLDLVQFAWWDYDVPGYVEAALWLEELRTAGKIRHLGATNFNTEHMREMLDAGVPLVANQVQYSLLDRRPEHALVSLARERGLGLLCYGVLAGGFLSAKYRDRAAPTEPLANRSLVKYLLIVDEAGGWKRYQELLRTLEVVAAKHKTAATAVALRWALDRSTVAAAMVGTFHGRHMEANLAALALSLTAQDREDLEVASGRLNDLEGDVFDLERVPEGRHSRIMWKNL